MLNEYVGAATKWIMSSR